MNHKQALQQIVSISGYVHDGGVTANDALIEIVKVAREALADTGTGEAKKQYQDRKKAERDISVLERVMDNPTRLLCTNLLGDRLPDSFMPAVEAELARMRGAAENPEALRMIYRRNEGRK
jgi:hypothetical protein